MTPSLADSGDRDPVRAPVRSRIDAVVIAVLAVVAWAGVVAVGRSWGLVLHNEGLRLVLYTPPVLGGYRDELPDLIWLPAVIGCIGALALPSITARSRWWLALAVATVVAGCWWFSLAWVDGAEGLTRGLEWDHQYAAAVGPAAADPLGYLRSYLDGLPDAPVQLRGHPPGFVLLLGGLDHLGLASPGWVATIIIAIGLSAVGAVALTTRELAGEGAARRVLPFLALTPAASWLVTSVDTLFVGLTAWLVFVLVLAMRCTGRRSIWLALLAGVLGAFAAMLSYGLVLVGVVPVIIAAMLRRWRPVVIAGATAAGLVCALGLAGFWWFSGLAATRHEYETLGVERPYHFFLVNNLSAWALALGPAVAVGLALLRDRRVWALAGGGLAAGLLANLSGLSEGEVERIWLPFTIWVVVATAALGVGLWQRRGWLMVQVLSSLALTGVIATYW